jgi:hypothetical protein
MNKLYELAALIPKGLSNLDKVIEGNINSIKLENGHLSSSQVEEIARRRAICAECPLMSNNAKELGYKTRRVRPFCTACGCPTKTKTASLTSNCGIEELNKQNPDNQLPLRWAAYDGV